jgi:predicted RNase H-like nuclease (RuvC/YqgF family)
MKRIKNTVIISYNELMDREDDMFKRGEEYGKKVQAARVKDLEKSTERLKEKIELKDAAIEKLEAKVEVLEGDRDNVREVLKKEMANEDTAALLSAKEESLERREEALTEREEMLTSVEEGNYKKGYADGVADGVRKISEIGEKDRENAMKIAMMAAASHSTPEAIKELTSGTTAQGIAN